MTSRGFKTSVEEVTADVVETARELELEVDPEDGTESLPLLIKLECRGSRFSRMSRGSGVLGGAVKFVGENVTKFVEITTEDLEYYINLSDKAVAGFERTDFKGLTPVLKEVLHYLVKCCQIALQAAEKSLMQERAEPCGTLCCCPVLRNCHSCPDLPEKATATHSSTLAWTGEPGGLPSMGSHRVGHD